MALTGDLGNSRLPELFAVIIDHDRAAPDLRAKVVSLAAVRKWRGERLALTEAAERFIRRQRKA